MKKQIIIRCVVLELVLSCFWVTGILQAAQMANQTPVLQIKADQVKGKVSPTLYGLMTEEINFCYDGGLYAELIRNRIFKEVPRSPGGRRGQPAANATGPRTDGLAFWELVQTGGGSGSMAQDANQQMNEALTNSLKLTVNSVSVNQRVGISNEGFWGIAVRPNTQYKATIWAKGGNGFTGPLTLAILSSDGKTVYAQKQVDKITDSYQKYEATLNTTNAPTTKDARFQIWAGNKGTVWFSLVSLFPPTYKNRLNGNRPDIMQLLTDMNVKFLRFPGGNYLEGNTIATRFNWKNTIGDISQRPGHMNDAWGYWSSDGMGLLEFLQWCEDLNMEPVMGIYSGYSLRGQQVSAGEELKPYVQDALDEIEYTIGDTGTTWGARRAADGHPAPFKLNYVEVGNEENLGSAGGSYNSRFAQFYDAIKARYPNIKIISAAPGNTTIVQNKSPDVVDDHYYPAPAAMIAMWNKYDDYDRSKAKVFVGEYATRIGNNGPITPNMEYGLCDASFVVGLERNSDSVIMASYAPLFVNINQGASQWQTDLIGFDVLNSFGSVSYYVLKMFGQNHGDTILTVTSQSVPTREIPRTGGRRGGDAALTTLQVPTFFYDATRDSETGTIYLKVVNPLDTPQPINVMISGIAGIKPSGQLIELKSNNPEDLNSITEPTKIVPVTMEIEGLSTKFTHTFPPYSISVLKLNVN
jgi:alpha-L-arabinofuranosidase